MSIFAFEGTPLAALAANASLFASPDEAPQTALAFLKASDVLDPAHAGTIWAAHVADAERERRVRRTWAAHCAAVPLCNVVSGDSQPAIVDENTATLVPRGLVPISVAMLAALPTLSSEVNERPALARMRLAGDRPIRIDADRTVDNPQLVELLAMLSGANLARPSSDPRFTCVAVRCASATASELLALAPAIEKSSTLQPSACCAGTVDGKFSWVGIPVRVAVAAVASTAKTTSDRQTEIGGGRIF